MNKARCQKSCIDARYIPSANRPRDLSVMVCEKAVRVQISISNIKKVNTSTHFH